MPSRKTVTETLSALRARSTSPQVSTFSLERYEEFELGLFKINQLTLRGRLAVNRNWALTYGLRYSFESEIWLTNRAGVEYISKCRCWAIRLEVGGDRSGGAFFNVQYVLIGLGDDDIRPFSGGGIGSGGRDPLSGAQN